MLFERLEIPDVVKITPKRHADARGSFTEVFRSDLFRRDVANVDFVQHNQSVSAAPGTIRGLHFQIAPAAQGKLVRCLRGSILDIAVDVRPKSPTFGRHIAVTLSDENSGQLWIPPGFAHGFCSLEPDSEIFYALTAYYAPEYERGILWNDPELAIRWPVSPEIAVLSEKDMRQPTLREHAQTSCVGA